VLVATLIALAVEHSALAAISPSNSPRPGEDLSAPGVVGRLGRGSQSGVSRARRRTTRLKLQSRDGSGVIG